RMRTRALALEPGLAPVLPALSLAVQLSVCSPSPLTLTVALAALLPIPLRLLSVAPAQLRSLIVRWPLRSLALSVPTTGPCVNQPSGRSGPGRLSVSSGGVAARLGSCASDQGLASRPPSLRSVCVPSAG